jgi:hypothetical protein
MYKCEVCGKQQEKGKKANVVPSAIREVVYPEQRASRKNGWKGAREGRGTEWVGQVTLCDSCLEKSEIVGGGDA